MNKKTINQFLSNRPAISVTRLCEEAGITKRYLDYILSGERPLTNSVIKKIRPVMERYGYREGRNR